MNKNEPYLTFLSQVNEIVLGQQLRFTLTTKTILIFSVIKATICHLNIKEKQQPSPKF